MRSSCHSAAAKHARASQSMLLYLGKSLLNDRSDKMDLSFDSMRDNTKVGLSDKETRIVHRLRGFGSKPMIIPNITTLAAWIKFKPDSHCPGLEEVTGQHRQLSRK